MMCKMDFKIKTNNLLKPSASILLLQSKFLELIMCVLDFFFFESQQLGVPEKKLLLRIFALFYFLIKVMGR